MTTAQYDGDGCFLGHKPGCTGDHRTVGSHRAWCSDCTEWCYPDDGCVRCREAVRAASDAYMSQHDPYFAEQYGRHSCWHVNEVWWPYDRTPVCEILAREKWEQRVLAYGVVPLADRFVTHRADDG